MYALSIRSNPEGPVQRYRLANDSYTLGRSRLCEIPIPHQYLSRQHSRLELRNDAWWVVDLGSKNGTFVNDSRISEPTRVEAGDRIRIADVEATLEHDSGEDLSSVVTDPSSLGNSVILDAGKFLEQLKSAGSSADLSVEERRLHLLNEVHSAVFSTHDVRGFGRLMLDKLVELLDPDEGVVAQYRDGELTSLAGFPAASTTLTLSETLQHQVCDEGKAVLQQEIVNGSGDDSQVFSAGQSLILAGVWSLVATPILDDDRVIGMIALARSRKGFQAFVEQDLELLTSLSSVAALRIQNLEYLAAVEQQRLMEQEITIAREVQQSLLPDILPELPGYDLLAQNFPSRGVSGDIYQVFLTDDVANLLLIDVSGKGVPAAMLTATVEALVAGMVEAGQEPVSIADRLGGQLHKRTRPERYATGVLTRLDLERGRIEVVSAGHNPSLLIRAGGEVEQVRSTGPPWGLLPGATYSSSKFTLEPGDAFVLYSDGITEAENPEGEEYGIERLQQVCSEHRGDSLGNLVAAVGEDLDTFASGKRYHDDRTLLVVRRS